MRGKKNIGGGQNERLRERNDGERRGGKKQAGERTRIKGGKKIDKEKQMQKREHRTTTKLKTKREKRQRKERGKETGRGKDKNRRR